MKRGFCILFSAILAASLVFAIHPRAPAQAVSPPEPKAEKTDPLLENLEGADPEKGALAARDLLVQVVEAKSARSESYRIYLLKALDPGAIGLGGPGLTTAERLVGALGYTAGAGEPLPQEGRALVLKLIGAGPESLRKAVREAVASFARSELQGGESETFTVLVSMLKADPPPPPVALEEVSSILWLVDGKALLENLISALSRVKSKPRIEQGPYLLVLRERLDLDFPTPEDWERWWAENQDHPIEVILQNAHRQLRARQTELWQKVLRRIEGSLDPEAFLGAIADSLELDPTPELRGAAVEVLARFHDWLRDSKFPLDRNGAPTVEESRKAAFASRGLAMLLKFLDDADPRGFSSPRLRRKVLVALRSYAPHLERSPQDEAAVAAALLSGFRNVFPDGAGTPRGPSAGRNGDRGDVLELVRTAGALRIPGSRLYLERVLKEEAARGRPDLELVVETIGALGKVMERGVVRESVDLIMKCYRTNRDPADKAQRDIRKACVAALNLRIEDRQLRDDLRRFYTDEVLSAEDKSGRVPAILGLGILAKGGDREAAASLIGVLSRREQFDPVEVSAAVDAIAYLGGQEALDPLLRFIDKKDQPFADHVWRKTVSILKGQGLVLLKWSVSRILDAAFKEDHPEMGAVALRLLEEPELSIAISPERASSANAEEFVAYWEAMLARAKAFELSGSESQAAATLATLNDLAIKDGRMKGIRPQVEEELLREKARLDRLVEARSFLSRDPPEPPEAQAKKLVGVAEPSERAETRWRELRWMLLQVQGLKPTPEGAKVVDEVLASLSSSPSVWAEIAPETRTGYLKTLESLRDKLKVSATPGS